MEVINVPFGEMWESLNDHLVFPSEGYEKEFKNIEHGNRARHSLNRENSIMALIYVKRHYPEECKGKNGKETNEAWANATIDHWPHVGGDYDEPSTDYLKKIISDMDRLPEKRTTAGKKKS